MSLPSIISIGRMISWGATSTLFRSPESQVAQLSDTANSPQQVCSTNENFCHRAWSKFEKKWLPFRYLPAAVMSCFVVPQDSYLERQTGNFVPTNGVNRLAFDGADDITMSKTLKNEDKMAVQSAYEAILSYKKPDTYPAELEESTIYPDESAALNSLLSERPWFVAFGEFHRPRPFSAHHPHLTTDEVFAERILPILKDYGYEHLVLECLPTGLPQTEINWFFRHAQTDSEKTPLLHNLYKDHPVARTICETTLRSARDLGIHVYAGGVPYEIPMQSMPHATMVYGSYNYSVGRQVLLDLAQLYQGIIYYGGAAHNSLGWDPLLDRSDDQKLSFGQELAGLHSYLELDLMLPSAIASVAHGCNYECYNSNIALVNMLELSPPQRAVKLVRKGEMSYSLIYPFESP